MSEPAATVVVDCPVGVPGPAMTVAGMSVLERILREHARKGAKRAVVRGDRAALPRLPELELVVEIIEPSAPLPAGEPVRGDQLLGVQLDRESTRRAVEWALLQTCRRPYDGPGDRYVIRPISLRITRVLTRLPITPNHVTLVSLTLGLAAVALAAVGRWPAIGAAGLLMFAQVVLDSVDGELSRVRHMGSKLGMWLDNLGDDLLDNLLVVGLGAGLGGAWLAVGIAAAVGRGFSAVVTYAGAAAAGSPGDVMAFRWWFEDAEATADEAFATPGAGVVSLRALGRRDSYMLVYAASCCLAVPGIAFALGAINGAVYTVMACVHLVVRGGRP